MADNFADNPTPFMKVFESQAVADGVVILRGEINGVAVFVFHALGVLYKCAECGNETFHYVPCQPPKFYDFACAKCRKTITNSIPKESK